MKTAVEYLIEEISSKAVGVTPEWLLSAFEQAKAMEKEQIIKAHEDGFYSPPFRKSRRGEAEQYYNETYKNTD